MTVPEQFAVMMANRFPACILSREVAEDLTLLASPRAKILRSLRSLQMTVLGSGRVIDGAED